MKKHNACSFLHMGGNQYHILDSLKNVLYVVLAFPGVVKVDKHRTTLMTKRITNVDFFNADVVSSRLAETGDQEDWSCWVEFSGPHRDLADERISNVLDEISVHQERVIAKLITE